MKITLKKLNITAFKGAKNRIVEFDDVTDVSGANRTGKTTLFDAFTWLLFGKDSSDKKDFSVKPLDHNNKTTDKQDVEVSAILDIDGSHMALTRIMREKWVKKRGEATPEFAGNETLYFINEVPVSMADYNKAISEIIPEQTFKLLTSTTFFPSMKWEDKRRTVLSLVPNISDADIALGNPEFEHLLSLSKNLTQLKKEQSSKKALLKKSLDDLPPRIDELHKSKPEPVNETEVLASIASIETQIRDIENKIAGNLEDHKVVLEAQRVVMTKVADLKNKKLEMATSERQRLFELSSKQTVVINEAKGKISETESDIRSRKSNIELLTKQLTSKKTDLEAKRSEAGEVSTSAPVFDSVELCCPTCKRDFPSSDVDQKKAELTANFNREKVKKMAHINEVGIALKAEVERIEKVIEQESKILESLHKNLAFYNEKLTELQNQDTVQAPSLDQVLSQNPEYIQITNDIIELESVSFEQPQGSDDLKEQKKALTGELDALKSKLAVSGQIEKINSRIAELEKETVSLSQQIADIEKIEFAIEAFNKAKMESVTGAINSKFKMVSFKMYEDLINGGEQETCEILINGVPFSDANHASQINAGIDIINTFAKHTGVTAPIFIDNAEAVNDLLPSESQTIRLIVTTEPELTIKTHSKLESVA